MKKQKQKLTLAPTTIRQLTSLRDLPVAGGHTREDTVVCITLSCFSVCVP